MLYNQKEAARFLNVCMKTVERARADGRLNYRRIGQSIRFTQGDLDEFIMKSSIRPVPPEQDPVKKQQAGIWEARHDYTHTA
jgi:excisionase family DNA binding protein